jgi:hypothetical protein
MVTLQYEGRLSNNIIQFLAAYFFAKKNNLYFNPDLQTIFSNSGSDTKIIKEDRLPLLGHLLQRDLTIVTDQNFLQLFFSEKVEIKHYHFSGFFQQLKFLEYIKPHIREILDINNQVRPGELFVHYRIGDLVYYERDALPIWTPREYFHDAISKINFNSGWISSDTPDHPNVKWLISKYNLKVCDLPPLDTILFAKDSEYLVLSEYTFSGMIGYLSKNSKIWCNRRTLWSITPDTIQTGFDYYNILKWNFDNKMVAFNEDHVELNTLYENLSSSDNRLSNIRKFCYGNDTVFDLSYGTAVETIAILKAYPQKVISYYINDPIYSGTDINYVTDLAKMCNIEHHVINQFDINQIDCLVVSSKDELITSKLISWLEEVKKRIILSKDFIEMTSLFEARSFKLVYNDEIIVFDKQEN